jgi:hypothetical protein
MKTNNLYCSYYQARVDKTNTWFLTATLRSFEHLCFDRSLIKEHGLFEFFVPADLEPYFLELMNFYKSQGIVSDFQQLPTRLEDPSQEV